MNARRKEARILTPTEVENIEKEVREHEESKRETESSYDASGDWGSEGTNSDPTIRRMQKVLKQGKPGSLSREEKIKMEREVKEDQEYFSKTLVPRNLTSLRPGTPEFTKAVNGMIREEMTSSEFKKREHRYKNNIRQLHPDDRELHNIESFRPNS